MRLALIVIAALTVGALLPPAAEAASSRLKAVIIVDPTHGSTASYLDRAAGIADVAESYGMDVRRVFHPYATWSNVLDNVQGASLVVYLGHGNGWPSPYPPFQTDTKDGFGLNRYAGGSTSDVRYYGEGPISREIRLAPNAVVLLNHLCYASGNSEPGRTAPSVSEARQRADNYAAGFLGAGARAVFAYGWQTVSDVIRGLFQTNGTMDEIFMGTGYIGDHDIRFGSQRTSGRNVHMDPNGTANGYLRSVAGDLTMRASEFRGQLIRSHLARPALFYSRDGDALAPATTISLSLGQPATVSWNIINRAGQTVATRWNGQAASPGTYTWQWLGRDSKGAYVADGAYWSVVTATSATGTVKHTRRLTVGAFQITASARSASAGDGVIFSFATAEPLSARPSLKVTQPGLDPYHATVTTLADGTYRASITVRSGAAGTAEIRVRGVDRNGQVQATVTPLAIR